MRYVREWRLAKRAETYIQQAQREQQAHADSQSHEHYDAQQSRAEAFG